MSLVRECLEIALQVPSGSNRQGWDWVVVRDADRRAAIGEVYRRAVEHYLASPGFAGRLFADDPERAAVQQRVGESVPYPQAHMGEVPALALPWLRARSLPAGHHAGIWVSIPPAAARIPCSAR